MPDFFGSVNKMDSHNKSRKSDIALEKFWVMQCGCIWFYNTVAVGININN